MALLWLLARRSATSTSAKQEDDYYTSRGNDGQPSKKGSAASLLMEESSSVAFSVNSSVSAQKTTMANPVVVVVDNAESLPSVPNGQPLKQTTSTTGFTLNFENDAEIHL